MVDVAPRPNHAVELDVDGVHARGEVYNVSLLRRAADDVLDVWFGRYLDRSERRDDEWRVIHRVCVHEGDQTFDAGTPMPIVADAYRQGSFDRRAPGRLLEPRRTGGGGSPARSAPGIPPISGRNGRPAIPR